MSYIITILIGAVAGGAGVAWRLKGSRTVAETLRAVIQGGGGAGPRQPGSN